MSKRNMFATLLLVALLVTSSAQAGVYTFTPTPDDLWGLDHNKYYTWGIQWNHTGENIVGAVLTYKDIYDWTVETGDILHTHLLDNPALGAAYGTDNQGGGDYFGGELLIGDWTDPMGGSARGFDLVYDLSGLGLIDELNTYAADGVFGFGMDPDCHYYNDGIELKIITSTVPEPATAILLGLGLLAAGVARRRKD